MKRIFSGEILNITTFKKGFVFVAKETTDDGKEVARFYGFDATNNTFTRIKKSVFLKIKFGYEFEEIAKALGDYVSCDVGFLNDGKVMAIYPNGEYLVFNEDGSVNLSSQLTYHGAGVCDIAVDGQNIWCAVPDQNAVVKYFPREAKILLRIGGGSKTAFEKPTSVTLAGTNLYVCNQNSNKILNINTTTNTTRDYRIFKEKVYKYINVMSHEFVWLKSGLYELD